MGLFSFLKSREANNSPSVKPDTNVFIPVLWEAE
jgi:hypothetical protein